MNVLEVMLRSHTSGVTHLYRWFHQTYAANHTLLVRDMKIIKTLFKLKFLQHIEF